MNWMKNKKTHSLTTGRLTGQAQLLATTAAEHADSQGDVLGEKRDETDPDPSNQPGDSHVAWHATAVHPRRALHHV